MNENSKLFIILGVIVAGVIAIIMVSSNNNKTQMNELENFNQAFNGTENKLIYIGRPTCSYCSFLEPSLIDMSTRYDFTYQYINTDELNVNTVNEIADTLNIEEIATPYLAVVSNGEVIAEMEGYGDYDKTFAFLQENNIINGDAKLDLTYIGVDEYTELLEGKEKSIIVIGQSTCSYCITAKPILNDVANDTGIEINYLNTSYIQSQEEFDELTESLDYFEEQWGTPVALVVQDGELVDVKEGLGDYDSYVDFFTEVGIIGE